MLFIFIYALRPIYQSLTIIPISLQLSSTTSAHREPYYGVPFGITHPYAYVGISLITTFGQSKSTADRNSKPTANSSAHREPYHGVSFGITYPYAYDSISLIITYHRPTRLQRHLPRYHLRSTQVNSQQNFRR